MRQYIAAYMISLIMAILGWPGRDAWAESLSPAAAPQRIELNHGESIDLKFPAHSDVHVSQRGVVDLLPLQDGLYQATGLRSGLVLVEASEKRYLVRVKKVEKTPPSQDGGIYPIEASPLPAWICLEPNIRCEQERHQVLGLSQDHWWYVRAAMHCAQGARCLFKVDLSADQQQIWLERLQRRLGPLYSVHIDGGVVVIKAACANHRQAELSDRAAKFLSHEFSANLAVFRCLEDDYARRQYIVYLKAIWLTESAAEQLGFSPHSLVSIDISSPGRELELASRLRSLRQEHRAEIIGEPVIRLVEGETIEMLNGAEFQVQQYETARVTRDKEQDRIYASWKEYGLKFSVQLSSLAVDRLRMKLDLALRSRADGAKPEIYLNTIKTQVDVQPGVVNLLSLFDLAQDSKAKESTPIFAQIPLIGPLFSLPMKSASTSRLFLWVRTDIDTSHALPSASTELKKRDDWPKD